MTRHTCVGAEALEDLLRATPDDPRRREAAACPRCAALLAQYAVFLESRSQPGANLVDARLRIRSFVEREIVAGMRADGVTAEPNHGQATRRSWAGRWALVWATAAVVVAIGVVSLLRTQRTPGGDVFRGGPEPGAPAHGVALESLPSTRVASGGWILRWHPMASSSRYEVELLDIALETTGTVPAGPDTMLILDPAKLDRFSKGGEVAYWRVVAVGDGGEIAASSPRVLDER